MIKVNGVHNTAVCYTGALEPAAVGDIIKFGKYEWRVLDVQNEQALIISKDVTHVNMPYNEEYVDATWETCSLRKWLNDEFFNTFSGQEKLRILPTTNINEDNQWFGTKGGNKTTDHIFLLSLSEVVRYFGDSNMLSTKRPVLGEAEMLNFKFSKFGVYTYGTLGECYIHDQYSVERVANYRGSAFWWWLRSSGGFGDYAACVDNDGDVDFCGSNVSGDGSSGGVRPALWLNL